MTGALRWTRCRPPSAARTPTSAGSSTCARDHRWDCTRHCCSCRHCRCCLSTPLPLLLQLLAGLLPCSSCCCLTLTTRPLSPPAPPLALAKRPSPAYPPSLHVRSPSFCSTLPTCARRLRRSSAGAWGRTHPHAPQQQPVRCKFQLDWLPLTSRRTYCFASVPASCLLACLLARRN